MSSLLNTVNQSFSHEFVGHVAARLGEGESGIRNALGGILPMVLAGLINKVGIDEGATVLELSKAASEAAQGRYDSLTGLLGLLGSGYTPGGGLAAGEQLLGTLFGTYKCDLAELIGTHAGIRASSARDLFALAGVVLPDLLGQLASRLRLRATEVAALLLGLKKEVRALLPAGMHGLTGLLWLGGLGTNRRTTASGTPLGKARPGTAATTATWYQLAVGALGTVVLALLLVVGNGLG
jgi:hypothetical protein